jgi:hypothetical protein
MPLTSVANLEKIVMTQDEKDYVAFKAYVDLWAAENPIKTNKLQVLLVVNGLLVSALQLGGGFQTANWPIFLAGSLLSAIWILSIGRTSLFQKTWQIKALKLAEQYPDDPRFQLLDTGAAEAAAPCWLRYLGGVSSKYYLLGAPVFFSIIWAAGLVYIIAAGG